MNDAFVGLIQSSGFADMAFIGHIAPEFDVVGHWGRYADAELEIRGTRPSGACVFFLDEHCLSHSICSPDNFRISKDPASLRGPFGAPIFRHRVGI